MWGGGEGPVVSDAVHRLQLASVMLGVWLVWTMTGGGYAVREMALQRSPVAFCPTM